MDIDLSRSAGQDVGILVSKITLSGEKGGDFFIDMDRQMLVGTSPYKSLHRVATAGGVQEAVGFGMNFRVQGEGKKIKPVVELAVRHITCVEDMAMFMVLATSVDLSIEAYRPFRRKAGKGSWHSIL
ncbi:hypothetical protein KSP39_PZI005943 [Platanthera zijinensis]|uniref:Uncharacterized protein n=1 Tax=Platanthera zijinensis TaxID=2320716 RepID=A0AAP0BTI0_9ASPA